MEDRTKLILISILIILSILILLLIPVILYFIGANKKGKGSKCNVDSQCQTYCDDSTKSCAQNLLLGGAVCTRDSQCVTNNCISSTGTCSCSNDLQCPDGYVCNNQGTCIPYTGSCSVDADCVSQGMFCENSQCKIAKNKVCNPNSPNMCESGTTCTPAANCELDDPTQCVYMCQ